MSTVNDLYTESEFETLLSDAESNAANEWEEDFCSSLREKWDQYGKRMYLSDAQQEHLERIAND